YPLRAERPRTCLRAARERGIAACRGSPLVSGPPCPRHDTNRGTIGLPPPQFIRDLPNATCGITAARRIPLWLAGGSGCRGRRLSRERGNPGRQSLPWSYLLTKRTLYPVASAPGRRWDR